MSNNAVFQPDHDDFLRFTLANPLACESQAYVLGRHTLYVEDTGILRIEPQNPAPVSLVLSVGVHGNETGPIELVNNLIKDVLSQQLDVQVRLLVLIGNPVAANAGVRFTEVNMNRLFSGAWQQFDCPEATRAARLEKAVTDFFNAAPSTHMKLHYDLHTAIRGSQYEKFAVYPFVHGNGYSQSQLGFLAASGLDAILLSHQSTTTFSYYSYRQHGAHGFTLELGKVYPFGQNDLSRFSAIDTSLRQLMASGALPQGELAALKLFNVQAALVKDAEDYRLHIGQEVKNFTAFDVGFCLASSAKSQYLVEADGDAIIFPNANLPIGQRAGLVVRPANASELDLID